MSFLSSNQQCQRTEGEKCSYSATQKKNIVHVQLYTELRSKQFHEQSSSILTVRRILQLQQPASLTLLHTAFTEIKVWNCYLTIGMLIAVRQQQQQLRLCKHWINNGHRYHVKCKIPCRKLHTVLLLTTITKIWHVKCFHASLDLRVHTWSSLLSTAHVKMYPRVQTKLTRHKHSWSWLCTSGTRYSLTLDLSALHTSLNDISKHTCSDTLNLKPPAPPTLSDIQQLYYYYYIY